MALKTGDQVHIDAFCQQCEATYYRTIRPVIVGRDKLTPDLFSPIKAGTPPPDPNSPTCPTCSSTLRFITSAKSLAPGKADTAGELEPALSPSLAEEIVEQQRVRRPLAESQLARSGGPTRSAGAVVDVLFAVEDGEQVLDIKDTGGAYLVVTNRRILKVSYE